MKRLCTLRIAVALALGFSLLAGPALGKKHKKGVPSPSASIEYKPSANDYTVQKGDTLWDVSARLCGSPWFWPRVWSYNPEMTNPHWIYPGDVVRLQPSDIALPSRAELIADRRDMPAEGEDSAAVEHLSAHQAPAPSSEGGNVEEVASRALPALARRKVREVVNYFVTPRELAESGTLTNAVDDKILLAPSDQVFITFPKGKVGSPGERFMIYRTLAEVRHPVSGQRYGYMTEVTGMAKVVMSEDDVSRATVTEARHEVERGQLVTPLVQLPLANQRPTAARVPLSGVIVAVAPSGATMAGQRQFAFIDIGEGSGLELGNRLRVFLRRDRLADEAIPATTIGELMVVDIKPNASTCVVVESRQEIMAGLTIKTITR